MSCEFDCVVVGAGITGSTLAVALHGLGLTTAVVEARPLPAAGAAPEQVRQDQRGLALSVASQRILQGLGLWPLVAAHATPITRVHVSDQGRFAATRLEAVELGFEALGYVCPAATLAAGLAGELARAEGLVTYAPAQVVAIDNHADGLELRIEAGDAVQALRARLLVVADGSTSRTRSLLGIGARDHDYARSAVVAGVSVARPQPDTAFERFTREGPIALLPMGGVRYVAVMTVAAAAAEGIMSAADAEFLPRLHARFGDRLGRFVACGPRSLHPLRLTRAECITARRAVLAGNAANTVHPNAAQGLNLGLRDVAALVDCLVDCRQARGDAATAGRFDAGSEDVVDRYRRMREPDQHRVVRFTDSLANLFTTELGTIALARGLSMLAIDLLPPLKSGFVRRAAGLGGRPPRLACGIPLAGL